MSSSQPTEKPQANEGFDEPLSDPLSDLLDMDEHSQALARFIRQHEKQRPFTVGIFGEWGEGKTTLVQFLRHHLSTPETGSATQPIKFVSFSAWPYTTSEKLWRALILEIARVLYNRPRNPPTQDADQNQKGSENNQPKQAGWWHTLNGFLTGDVFVINKTTPPPDEFEDLVKQLDNIGFGKISKRSQGTQLNQEAMMSAVINGAAAVLSTVSPVVAGLRSLFGLGSKIDPSKLVQGESEETSREAIEALPAFRKIFSEMVEKKSGGEPVYVFIDDLDRAQPDVALDIMESVRIALAEVPCVFIVAVDQRLIAQGLRLRYRELFLDETAESFAAKGQEYLEKIIQFHTRVPPRTAEQSQRLISAQFPHWMPAGDIIQNIAGTNPRRLKQYCQRLSFQNMTGLSPFMLGSTHADEAAIPASGPPGSSSQKPPAEPSDSQPGEP